MVFNTQNGLTCPTCKKVYGIKTGDMPDGTMHVRHTRQSLPGHEGNGTIEIVYNFSPGIHVSLITKDMYLQYNSVSMHMCVVI